MSSELQRIAKGALRLLGFLRESGAKCLFLSVFLLPVSRFMSSRTKCLI
jgi:hypothetical protein